jgi:hypothetical protein
MAENSKREQIILADIAILEGMSQIKTVKRTLQSHSDLQEFAGTQLPVAAVVGKLPVPVNHKTGRDGQVDMIISNLAVELYVYFQENVSADKEISDLLDDLWAALYSDPTRGGLCMLTTLTANPNYESWPPYVAFQVSCEHKYQHSIGGI